MIQKKYRRLVYTLVGGLIGFFVGVMIGFDQYEVLPDFFSDISKPMRKVLGLFYNCSEVSCAIDYVLAIILTYTIIGLILGWASSFIKKNEGK